MRRCARHSMIMTLAALPEVLLAAGNASAGLQNAAFDDGGGSLAAWTTFNDVITNVVAAATTPRSGTHVAKVFGGFNGNPNYSGLFQNLAATPGETWEASAYVRHNADDGLAGTPSSMVMKIEFYRVPGGAYGTSDMLSESEILVLDGASPQDVWTFHSFQAVAPPQTVEARIVFVFIHRNNTAGAALIDDVGFDSESGSMPTGWDLIWNDEFDGDVVDDSKWRVEDAFLIKNNELQYYAPDDVYVANSILTLRSQERLYQGHPYTSGLVESIDRFATAYGRIEVCAKLPSGQGIWPAHWMLPTSGAWPPEIDIMELLGHEPFRVYMTHHWGTWPNVASHGDDYFGPDFSQGFHRFAVEWMPGRIDWFVDDELCFTSTVMVPNEPFYIILNTAVGGNWPGNPDETTVFPQYHEIDYVRVYAPSDPGDPLAEIIDSSQTAASADGVLAVGEYAGSASGINAGFGDLIGDDSVLYWSATGNDQLNLALMSATEWPESSPDGVVIYIDSAPGGFASTVGLTDVADASRRLASGVGSSGQSADLFFAPGFRADYAICLQEEFVSVYRLEAPTLALLNGAMLGAETDLYGGQHVVYRIDDGTQGRRLREIEIRLPELGVPTGESTLFVATLLKGDFAYRSNEFIAVATGNPWDGTNIGNGDAVLKLGDFVRFSASACLQDSDCHDGDPCTMDRCDLSVCHYTAARYGDVDGNDILNLFDIFCVLDGMGGDFSRCDFISDDVEPCEGNGVLNLFDVLAVLGAITGVDPCCE